MADRRPLVRSIRAGGKALLRSPQREASSNSSPSIIGATPCSGRAAALEYHVAHPPWQVWRAAAAEFAGDASPLYGAALTDILKRRPDSAFIADGSAVTVSTGRKII